MITFTWNSVYEGSPGAGLNRNALDNELRLFRRGIRGIMEEQHEWGPFSALDDGSHKKGYVAVLGQGTVVEMNSVANPREGGLYLVIDGGDVQLYLYINSAWEKINDLKHSLLSNLLDTSCHPQYVIKAGDTLGDDLDMSGNKISLDSWPGYTVVNGNVVYGGHKFSGHPTLGNLDAITDTEIAISKFNMSDYSAGFVGVGGGGSRGFPFPNAYIFCPNFYSSDSKVTWIYNLEDYDWGVKLYAPLLGGTRDISVKFKYMYRY